METRTITVISASTNSRKAINSSATTLAELKADLAANGIDFKDMSFYEGVSRTELIDDLSQLPHDVMFRGQPTNNLVILLTLQNKKIKSGALSEERKNILDQITALGLNNAVLITYGRNCTQVSTDKLKEIIEQAVNTVTPSESTKEESVANNVIEAAVVDMANTFNDLVENVRTLEAKIRTTLESFDNDLIENVRTLEAKIRKTLEAFDEALNNAEECCGDCKKSEKATLESPYTDDELDNIISGI